MKTKAGNNACSDVIHVEETVDVLSGAHFGNAYKGYSTYGKQYTFEISGNMHLKTRKAGNDFYIDEKIIRLYRNGVLVDEMKTSDLDATVVFKDVEVSYGKDDDLKAQLFVNVGRGIEVSGPSFPFTDQIDTLANTYTSGSNAAKPAKNVIKYNRSINPRAHSYCSCDFVVTKVELKGSTYYVTGYAVNNRIFKCNKYSKLKVSMKVGSKKVFSKNRPRITEVIRGLRVLSHGGFFHYSSFVKILLTPLSILVFILPVFLSTLKHSTLYFS